MAERRSSTPHGAQLEPSDETVVPATPVSSASVLRVGLYLLLVALSLVQQPGRTTYDTRLELTESPGEFLAGAFRLWHPDVTLGEIQNQAYGYLFPQGPFFWLADLAAMPSWLTQRLWSALVLLIAAEGARRVALRLGLTPGPALVVALTFAASPRLLGTVGVISAESLPGAVMPWALLPLLVALQGEMSPRRAAVLSAAGVACMGGVNAVEVIGSLPLLVVFILWGIRTGRSRWAFLGWWSTAVLVACSWWLLPLLMLGAYSPPFFDYVESASSTTGLLGWLEATRGSTHWVSYVVVADEPWWPAAYAFATSEWLVVVTAAVSAVGLWGLTRMSSPWRVPLVIGATVGLVALTIGHGTWAGSPIAGVMRDLLDGPLAPFRNVHKIDPVVRLPIAIGVGVAFSLAVSSCGGRPRGVRRIAAPSAAALVVAALLALLQPLVVGGGRTAGWTSYPEPWQETIAYLRAEQGDRSTWVVPGAGFAFQSWGRTMDEPLRAADGVRWFSRSQIPLAPGQSIRALDGLEDLIATGAASPGLGEVLARMGVGHVVVRRDLIAQRAESPDPRLAEQTLATSEGVREVADFGEDITVFEVLPIRPRVRLTAVDDVVTVRGAPEDVVAGVADGRLPSAPAVLFGERGWEAAADIVTDGSQRRERSYGRVYDGVGPVLAEDEPFVGTRAVPDYPVVEGQPLVTARYDGAREVSASSSQGFVTILGAVQPEVGPYAAFDDATSSSWVSSVAEDPLGQWVQVRFDVPRRVGTVQLLAKVTDPAIVPVTRLQVEAGDATEVVEVNPVTGRATAVLDTDADTLRVTVAGVTGGAEAGAVAVSDVRVDGEPVGRTWVVPDVATDPEASYLLRTTPEPRVCLPLDEGLSCDVARARGAEEADGLDRTFDLDRSGEYAVTGTAVARMRPGTGLLLDPLGDDQVIRASTTLGQDPAAGPRAAYDGDPETAWFSAPGDPAPRLSIGWDRPRTVRGIVLDAVGLGSLAPRTVTISSGDQIRTVDLRDSRVRFAPLRTRQMSLTFGGPAGTGVGVNEVDLLGVSDFARPVDRAAPTGAVCGLGPELIVDGRVVATRVDGTLGDVLDGRPLALSACVPGSTDEDAGVKLPAGEIRLRAVPTDQFQVTSLELVDPAASSLMGRADQRTVVESWSDDRRVITVPVEGAEQSRLLSMPENFNRGWRASVDGESLEPLRVDGWQQAFVLPAGVAGDVVVEFGPQTAYTVVLVAGLLGGATVLLAALIALDRPGSTPVPHRRRMRAARPIGNRVRLVVMAELAILAGPVLVLGIVLAGWAAVRRSGAAYAAGAGAALVVAAALFVVVAPSAEVPAQALCAIGLGLVGGTVLWSRPAPGVMTSSVSEEESR